MIRKLRKWWFQGISLLIKYVEHLVSIIGLPLYTRIRNYVFNSLDSFNVTYLMHKYTISCVTFNNLMNNNFCLICQVLSKNAQGPTHWFPDRRAHTWQSMSPKRNQMTYQDLKKED